MKTGMECPMDPVLQDDLEIVAKDEELYRALRGKRILVTGATGLVGAWLVRALSCMNRVNGWAPVIVNHCQSENDRISRGDDKAGKGKNSSFIQIYGVIRNKEKAAQIYGKEFMERPDVHFIVADMTDPGFPEKAERAIKEEHISFPDGESSLDLVIHGAAVTASKMMVEKPVETIMTAVLGTRNVLELAHRCGAADFVYLSSMEMYGDLGAGSNAPSIIKSVKSFDGGEKTKEDVNADTRATEERLGWLDLGNVRSDYPESKRMCENLCIGYGKEYGLHVKIARLAQTFGAGILPWENRVFAQFARSAMRGENIVLHTKGLSEGNYCYTRDAVRGILSVAEKGETGEAYNVANEEAHTTIAAMAEMVAERIAGGKIKVVYDIPEGNVYGYAADTKLFLDSSKLRLLGWKPEVGLEEMYRRMIASMRTMQVGGKPEERRMEEVKVELQKGRAPYSLVNPVSGEVVAASENPQVILEGWKEDQSRKIVDADGRELGIISAASRPKR